MKFNYGLEIECELPYSNQINRGDYHEGIKCGKYWTAERDGSLHTKKGGYNVEFVSVVLTKEQIPEAIRELKAICKDDANRFHNFSVNNSCGAHIHFSTKSKGKIQHFYKQLPPSFVKEIGAKGRETIAQKFPKYISGKFEKQYNRGYARQFSGVEYMRGRYYEFNTTETKGMEWRSFNLQGVRTWEQMEQMYLTAADVIETVMRQKIEEKQEIPMESSKKSEKITIEFVMGENDV
jgi:hypothetical protein